MQNPSLAFYPEFLALTGHLLEGKLRGIQGRAYCLVDLPHCHRPSVENNGYSHPPHPLDSTHSGQGAYEIHGQEEDADRMPIERR